MRLLVTGATGFIGSNLGRLLLAEHEVAALVRKLPAEGDPAGPRWIEQDLTRPLDYVRLPSQIDAVIHLAQSRLYKQFPEGATDTFNVNVYGTFQLLEYARRAGAKHFIFASSGGVYDAGPEKLTESHPVSPSDFYSSSKYAAELLLGSYARLFNTIIFRFFFVYGPGQKGMLVPTLVRKVQDGEAIVVPWDPGMRINPIYVEDAVRVFQPALQFNGSGLFNVAGDESVTITDLVRIIEDVVGKRAIIEYAGAARSGDLIGDNERMKVALAADPAITLREGLASML